MIISTNAQPTLHLKLVTIKPSFRTMSLITHLMQPCNATHPNDPHLSPSLKSIFSSADLDKINLNFYCHNTLFDHPTKTLQSSRRSHNSNLSPPSSLSAFHWKAQQVTISQFLLTLATRPTYQTVSRLRQEQQQHCCKIPFNLDTTRFHQIFSKNLQNSTLVTF